MYVTRVLSVPSISKKGVHCEATGTKFPSLYNFNSKPLCAFDEVHQLKRCKKCMCNFREVTKKAATDSCDSFYTKPALDIL